MITSYPISFEKTGYFSKLFLDYVNQEKNLNHFYKYSPCIDSFEQALKDISFQKFNRQLLVDIISRQYAKASCQLLPNTHNNCQLLLNENTFTVCTGHQLCLFTGPLYFIYKIISAINLAEELKKKFSSYNFVPVYWMMSEDHDFEEVNHIHLFGKKIEWKLNDVRNGSTHEHSGMAVGELKTESLKEVLDELKLILDKNINANELLELFSKTYLKREKLADATRYLINELFGKYGLLILDPNDVQLKKEFAEIIKDDLLLNSPYQAVKKTIDQLQKFGYKSQVNPRDINLFYLIDNQRQRIVKEKELFNVINTSIKFDKEQLLSEVETHPQRFSPNVVTRSLYQQKILPNLAYVGGPAEISYWLEYKGMFEHYGIFFPVLIPRNFIMLIDENIFAKMKKLGLSAESLFLPVTEIIKKFIKSKSDEKISLNNEKEQIKKIYDSISEKVSSIDITLVAAVKSACHKHLEEIENLEKKMLRVFKERNKTAVSGIEKVKEKLFPNGQLQERHENFISFYLKYGNNFIEEIKQCLNPFDFRFTVLTIE